MSRKAGPRGEFSAANNDPFGCIAHGRVDHDPWSYGAFYAPGRRAGRIEAELSRLVHERRPRKADTESRVFGAKRS